MREFSVYEILRGKKSHSTLGGYRTPWQILFKHAVGVFVIGGAVGTLSGEGDCMTLEGLRVQHLGGMMQGETAISQNFPHGEDLSVSSICPHICVPR